MTQVSASTARTVTELRGVITFPPELDWFFNGEFIDKGENALVFGGSVSGKFNMCKRIIAPNVMDRGKTAFFAVCAHLLYTQLWEHRGPEPTAIPGVNPRMIDCDMLVIDGLPEDDSPHHQKCTELLALRAKQGRSTIILVNSWDAQPTLLDERYPGKLEPRVWHLVVVPRPPMAEH